MQKQTLHTKTTSCDHITELVVRVPSIKINDFLILSRLKSTILASISISFKNSLFDWLEGFIFLTSNKAAPACQIYCQIEFIHRYPFSTSVITLALRQRK